MANDVVSNVKQKESLKFLRHGPMVGVSAADPVRSKHCLVRPVQLTAKAKALFSVNNGTLNTQIPHAHSHIHTIKAHFFKHLAGENRCSKTSL